MSLPSIGWNNALEITDGQYFNSSDYRGGVYSFGSTGAGILYGLHCESNHLRAYNECPPLKSIVAKRAKAFNVGVIDVINKNTGKSAPGPEAKKFRQILKNPNPLQTQKQFFAQQNIYIDVFGYCPVFMIRPFGVNDEITAIWNMPPWLFNIEFTGQWLQQTTTEGIFKGYSLQWVTGNQTLLSENLRLIFDDGFGTDMDINLTIPDSRLRGQEYPISNIIASLKARNSLITRRGPTGILSNKGVDTVGHMPLPIGEKDRIQQDFSRYGITGQEFQVMITEANVQWQQMGFSTKDLMLFEEIEDDVNSLCDAYGWFPELLARTKGATFDNKEKAEKMAYTATIIPESDSRIEQLSNAVIGKDNTLEYKVSFAHAPALQAEKLQNAQARKELDTACEKEFKNNAITLNMWLQALELPARTDEFGNMYYNDLMVLGWAFGNTTATGGDNQPTQTDTNQATQ